MKFKVLKLGVTACAIAVFATTQVPVANAGSDASAVVQTYADIAQAMYSDALVTAIDLKSTVDQLIAEPTEQNLSAARKAWVNARVPYQQTEGLRFGNAMVDDWEGKVNAWPLDEGLIDYVDASYGTSSDENPSYTLNVIANTSLQIGPDTIDAREITPELLSGSLQEAQGVEANVATGYHAIEFLLWGQDLNGTGPGAGNRPASDFNANACTGGNCERRAEYLVAATDLLISDLREMVAAWDADGAARADIAGKSGNDALATILTGLGSLSYGELAGERIKLGLILHDPEEEHDCFSDNTHNSHYYDQVGMIALYNGTYTRVDGSTVSGASLKDLAASKASGANAKLVALMSETLDKMQVMKDNADSGTMAYDQMIGEGNVAGNKVIQDVVDALVAQAKGIEALVAALGINISVEGSDSLDNPSSIDNG